MEKAPLSTFTDSLKRTRICSTMEFCPASEGVTPWVSMVWMGPPLISTETMAGAMGLLEGTKRSSSDSSCGRKDFALLAMTELLSKTHTSFFVVGEHHRLLILSTFP